MRRGVRIRRHNHREPLVDGRRSGIEKTGVNVPARCHARNGTENAAGRRARETSQNEYEENDPQIGQRMNGALSECRSGIEEVGFQLLTVGRRLWEQPQHALEPPECGDGGCRPEYRVSGPLDMIKAWSSAAEWT